MSYTPRKSTSHTTAPPSPRRPCTPESNHGRSPRAPGPPDSPDRRAVSSEKPTKSYLRPTVSSIMHHGSSNTNQPRRSIDKPPFLPPSSMGVHSQHHKNPSSSSRGSLSLKGILTRATNAMKSGTDRNRKSSAGAGLNIDKGSGTSTPVRPRNPAPLPRKKERSRNFARSNSVPKKLGVLNKDKERDTMSISSIEENLPEHLPDPVEITPHAPENVFQSTAPHVKPQEPSYTYTEKIEENVHEQVIESFIAATDGYPIEENHEVVMLEEINESPKEVDSVKVIEECREELPKMEEEVEETPKETENAVIIGEKQEEEAPEFEAMNVVEELPQETDNVAIVEEDSEKQPEEAITDLPKEPEETVIVNDEVETIAEEDVEKPEETEEKEITITENHEAPKDEVDTQDKVEEEKPAVESETKVEETPKEENGTVVEETPKEEENGTIEEIPKVEEKPIATETENKKEEDVTVTPKVEEKPVSPIVAELKKEKATFKKPDAISTRREGAVSNDVIEETKSKLMEKRKNKVLALVGAFETVMHKPEEGNTRR